MDGKDSECTSSVSIGMLRGIVSYFDSSYMVRVLSLVSRARALPRCRDLVATNLLAMIASAGFMLLANPWPGLIDSPTPLAGH